MWQHFFWSARCLVGFNEEPLGLRTGRATVENIIKNKTAQTGRLLWGITLETASQSEEGGSSSRRWGVLWQTTQNEQGWGRLGEELAGLDRLAQTSLSSFPSPLTSHQIWEQIPAYHLSLKRYNSTIHPLEVGTRWGDVFFFPPWAFREREICELEATWVVI